MKVPFQMAGVSGLWARGEDNMAKKSWMGLRCQMSFVFKSIGSWVIELYKSWIDMIIILGIPDLKIVWGKRSKTTLHSNLWWSMAISRATKSSSVWHLRATMEGKWTHAANSRGNQVNRAKASSPDPGLGNI